MNTAEPIRRRGRPVRNRDKNGRPVPVRADRDRPIQWFFEAVPRPDFDDALQLSGDERFYRLHDALHDDAYRRTSPGTLCRRFGVSLQDLHELWRKYNISLGMMRGANHLPSCAKESVEFADLGIRKHYGSSTRSSVWLVRTEAERPGARE